jgi:hypothetical protein
MATPVFAGDAARPPAPGDGEVCGRRGSPRDLEVIGLTGDQRLVCFRENRPEAAREIGPVVGLMGGETLVGIDFRPANGMLYGLGSAAGIYTIDPTDATATFVARLVNMATMMPVALSGTSFGIDFNPVPDRLRVVSDAGQNLRINVDNGVTIVDAALNPAPGTGVTGVGYTNNDNDPNTQTVLFDIDTLNDQLSIQAPPNNGTLNPVGKLTVKNAVQDVGLVTGFDIFSRLRAVSPATAMTPQINTTVEVRALATLTVGMQTQVYRVNLVTGAIEPRGAFRAADAVIDIGIPLLQGPGPRGPGSAGPDDD